MFCKKCGKKNPENSQYCQYCGNEFGNLPSEYNNNIDQNQPDKFIGDNQPPYPYAISNWKLVIMCLSTFGIYEIFWFYKQWKSFNTKNNLGHGNFTLWIYSIFAPISSYSLFKHISSDIKDVNQGKGLEAGGLAIVYFVLSRLWLGFIPLIIVQNKINLYWEKNFGKNLVRSKFGIWNWIIVIIVAVMFILAFSSEDTATDTTQSSVTPALENYDQEEIASSVVNIFCPSIYGEDYSTGGSGIILTEEGIILTNSHIIPQDETDLHVDETGCLVVLPDPSTGQPLEIYLANPIVLPGISDEYDLAYMQIYSAYYDEEAQEYKGTFPKVFPAFDDTTRCNNENVKLGEAVRIFGYPAISGGYSLTITDGVVSSFPGDGLIVTSAKISHGNSGGLAVDKYGCMLGVPSLVSSDDSETLGVIYSMDLVRQFSSEVESFVDEQ